MSIKNVSHCIACIIIIIIRSRDDGKGVCMEGIRKRERKMLRLSREFYH